VSLNHADDQYRYLKSLWNRSGCHPLAVCLLLRTEQHLRVAIEIRVVVLPVPQVSNSDVASVAHRPQVRRVEFLRRVA